MTFDDRVRAVLAQVYDPCSVAAGRPTSVLDMGLVLGWTLAEGTLMVKFCVTFPGCTMAPHFTGAAAEALAGLPGVERVETVVDTAWVWTPPARRAMAGTPQEWRLRSSPSLPRGGGSREATDGGARREASLCDAPSASLRSAPPRGELGEIKQLRRS